MRDCIIEMMQKLLRGYDEEETKFYKHLKECSTSEQNIRGTPAATIIDRFLQLHNFSEQHKAAMKQFSDELIHRIPTTLQMLYSLTYGSGQKW
jgi:hypothetical protein